MEVRLKYWNTVEPEETFKAPARVLAEEGAVKVKGSFEGWMVVEVQLMLFKNGLMMKCKDENIEADMQRIASQIQTTSAAQQRG